MKGGVEKLKCERCGLEINQFANRYEKDGLAVHITCHEGNGWEFIIIPSKT